MLFSRIGLFFFIFLWYCFNTRASYFRDYCRNREIRENKMHAKISCPTVDDIYRNNRFSRLKILSPLLSALILTLNIFFWPGERLFTVSTWFKLVDHFCTFLRLIWWRWTFLPDFFFWVQRIMPWLYCTERIFLCVDYCLI